MPHTRKEVEQQYAGIWSEALRLPGLDLRESAISDLVAHFRLGRAEVEKRLETSEEDLAREFAKRNLDATNPEHLARFYNEQDLEAFELMGYHVQRGHEIRGALKYVLALEVAKRQPGRRYLDLGSGVGSGAVLFARHGFEPTLADIAAPLLSFARSRLERRQIVARFVDMRTEDVPDGSVDFITCFDVLEHAAKPLDLVAWCRRKLAPGGLLAVFAAFGKDEDNPLHVVHDRRLHRRFRSLGFDEDATASRFAYELGLRKLLFLSPVARSKAHAAWVGLIDRVTPTFLRGLGLKMRGTKLEASLGNGSAGPVPPVP